MNKIVKVLDRLSTFLYIFGGMFLGLFFEHLAQGAEVSFGYFAGASIFIMLGATALVGSAEGA